MESYYDVLAVRRDADSRQLRRAYRSACRQWHPDKNAHPRATQKFQQVKEAYDVLSNGLSRIQYDLALDIQELGLSFSKPEPPADADGVDGYPDSSLDTATSGGGGGGGGGGYSSAASCGVAGDAPSPTRTRHEHGQQPAPGFERSAATDANADANAAHAPSSSSSSSSSSSYSYSASFPLPSPGSASFDSVFDVPRPRASRNNAAATAAASARACGGARGQQNIRRSVSANDRGSSRDSNAGAPQSTCNGLGERPKSADAAARFKANERGLSVDGFGEQGNVSGNSRRRDTAEVMALQAEIRKLKAYRRVQDAMIKRERHLRRAAERKLEELEDELADIRAAVELAASGSATASGAPVGLYSGHESDEGGGEYVHEARQRFHKWGIPRRVSGSARLSATDRDHTQDKEIRKSSIDNDDDAEPFDDSNIESDSVTPSSGDEDEYLSTKTPNRHGKRKSSANKLPSQTIRNEDDEDDDEDDDDDDDGDGDDDEDDIYDMSTTPLASNLQHHYKSPNHVLVDHHSREQRKFRAFQRKKIQLEELAEELAHVGASSGIGTKSLDSLSGNVTGRPGATASYRPLKQPLKQQQQQQFMTQQQAWKRAREQQALQRRQRQEMLDRVTEMTAHDDGDEIDTIVASLPERLDLRTAKQFAG